MIFQGHYRAFPALKRRVNARFWASWLASLKAFWIPHCCVKMPANSCQSSKFGSSQFRACLVADCIRCLSAHLLRKSDEKLFALRLWLAVGEQRSDLQGSNFQTEVANVIVLHVVWLFTEFIDVYLFTYLPIYLHVLLTFIDMLTFIVTNCCRS
jgi:hypothetical protein